MSVQEIVAQNPLKEPLDEILDHLRQERAKDAAAGGSVGVDGGDAGGAAAAGPGAPCVLEVPLSVLVTVTQLEADVDEELPRWRDFLDQQVSQFIKLIPDPDTFTALGDALRETVAKDKHVGNVILWYDIKTAGEASSNPNCRIPPFRAAHLKKMVQGFVRCRGSSEAGSVACPALFAAQARPSLVVAPCLT